MKLKTLGSSSKGNCHILSTPTGSLLLDAGLPWKEVQKGLNFDLSMVNGCLVTHEHKDHCKAVKEAIKAGINCYMSIGTWESMSGLEFSMGIQHHRIMMVGSKCEAYIQDFTILPFDTEHDAAEPLGFMVQYHPTGERLLYITDSYYSKYQFPGLNYILIECNYIKDTLDANVAAGYIDEGLKRRLLESHFSLEHVKEFLLANDLSQCREIILLHLSDVNSDAARMVWEIEEVTGIKPKVAVPGLEVELNLYPY